jgi:hypothetical protein
MAEDYHRIYESAIEGAGQLPEAKRTELRMSTN